MAQLDEEANQDSEEAPQPTYDGVFITKGASLKLTFPDGYLLRVSEDGEIEGGRAELHIGLDTCPYWLRIAYGHIASAESHRDAIREAVAKADDNELGPELENSFTAGMQAIMASAISIDALYAAVKEYITIPDDVRTAWATNKTARYKQIAETFRLGFQIGPKSFKRIRSGLEELFRFRDWAVHPPFKIDAPKPHPDIGKFTEWRFVAYRFDNAFNATSFALSVTAQLAMKPRAKFDELCKHCEGLQKEVLPLVEKWESRYGQVVPKEVHPRDAPSDDSAA